MRQPVPIAVLCGDLHLSLLRPVCRADKNWLETQAHYLHQLDDFAKGKPILCAGDVFDRWNPPPELIHFALRHLPENMYCVPGQHDLPLHRMDLLHRSGYGVLVQAKKIVDVKTEGYCINNTFWVNGFGWEESLVPAKKAPGVLQVALVHRYTWIKGKNYPGASPAGNSAALRKQLVGYQAIVTGDNHQDFLVAKDRQTLFNCGGFLRRKSDEISRKPCIGTLYSDGTIQRQLLDTSIDTFQEAIEARSEIALDMKKFLEQLENLGEQGISFRQAVRNFLRDQEVTRAVKEIVLTALNE